MCDYRLGNWSLHTIACVLVYLFRYNMCVQVYVPETGACVRRDKYWGRALSESGLREALRDFFAAGAGLRTRVVRHVLRELDALRRAIAKQTSYRFYSW